MGDDTLQSMPSVDPASLGNAGGMLASILNKFLQGIDDCLPATVVAYDRVSNTATVRPLVQLLAATGEALPRAQVASVPVLALGCGQFFVNFPLKAGDLGWIKATDRDISLYKQGLADAKPNTLRKHSFEDGIFIPDMVRNYTIDPQDMGSNMVISHKDGKIRIALWPDRVKVTAEKTSFAVRDNGEIEAVAPVKMLFDTPLAEFTGGISGGTKSGAGTVNTFQGGIRATEDVQSKSVSLEGHGHTGVVRGGDTSGEPVK